MNERIKKLRQFFIEEKGQKAYRQTPLNWEAILPDFSGKSDVEKGTDIFEILLGS